MTDFTLQSLAQRLGLEFSGEADLPINSVSSLPSAGPGDICFLTNRKYLPLLLKSQCSAVIAPPNLLEFLEGRPCLLASDPQYCFVQVITLLSPTVRQNTGVHPSALVADSAVIAADVTIGAGTVVGERVTIAAGSCIGASCVIDDDVTMGKDCFLHHRVVLEKAVVIGERCELHSGVVVGSDGFGLVMNEGEWTKIPQLGSVVIGDDVEIGANTTVDRGALDDTVIESGCKLDNQIQVAHNVFIGSGTAIAACVGIAGSAHIGRNCRISGAAVILGHLSIADDVTITAMSLVTKDIKKAGVYSSGTPLLENALWHRNNVRYKSLDKLARHLKSLEEQIINRE